MLKRGNGLWEASLPRVLAMFLTGAAYGYDSCNATPQGAPRFNQSYWRSFRTCCGSEFA